MVPLIRGPGQFLHLTSSKCLLRRCGVGTRTANCEQMKGYRAPRRSARGQLEFWVWREINIGAKLQFGLY
jgi:hypothetical protein